MASRLAPELGSLAEALARFLGDDDKSARAAALVASRAPDERLALASLLRLAEISPAILSNAFDNEPLATDLIFALGASELVGRDLAAMGPHWLGFFGQTRGMDATALDALIRCDLPDASEREALGRALGDFKRLHFLRIAIADLTRRVPVGGTMALMSRLADECVEASLKIARRLMGERASAAGRFCVLAMGKLGAGELNLSSDVDLVYLHEPTADRSSQEAAARLGELVTELMRENCFRVDMRLRPGGTSGPLVASLNGAIGFYQSFGQTWERAALLRARPVAGELELGRRFNAEMLPFIYRRYLDFDTLRQLREMKRQIDEELRSPDRIERNLKLGRGGIRELEFVVQALTLVYGGREPRLREARTLAALERLDLLGYLAREREQELANAYMFLRDAEHKLQVVAGLQTHSLPPDRQGLGALAARMGFGKGADAQARFREVLARHRAAVNRSFREMLAGQEEPAARPASAAAQAAWRDALEPRAGAYQLKQIGFANPAESAGHLELLARGADRGAIRPRRRELLDSLGPRLLDEIRDLPDPDLALMNLAGFISSVGARTSFLALLEQHPVTRRVLLRLFASSRYFSTIFIRHPDLLDTLVRSDLAGRRRSEFELNEELVGMLAAAGDFEPRLDALRVFLHQEFLRIAIADLAGSLTLEELQAELTLLAGVILRNALALAREEVKTRTQVPADLALCVLAMGRLGAAEMSYNSDLDLIFVYRDSGNHAGREAAARICQRLISVLEGRTREGYAYKLDLRLRPSGNAGPLVTSLPGFVEYRRQSSAVWERQALVRSRVVAGDSELASAVEDARLEFVFGRGLTPAEVGTIREMRERMEREIGAETRARLNLKQGRGGIVDVEFLAQMLALRYGAQLRELRQRGTAGLLHAAAQHRLIAAADGDRLQDHYRFLSQLENRLRIENDQAAWALPAAPAELTPLARRMGFLGEHGARRMLAELEARRREVRAIFLRYFESEERQTS